MKRTPEDICLLCKNQKSTQTNSHLIPAGLLKLSVGKRGYEFLHSIDTKTGSIRKHYGRANSPSPKIKPFPLSPDYYFCRRCENEMSRIEDTVLPHITLKLRERKFSNNYNQFFGKGGIKGKELLRVSSNNFNMFFLSIVWRFGIYYHLERKESPLTTAELELMRQILYCYLYDNQICYDELCDQFGLIVLSPDQFSKPVENLGFTVKYINRPSFFYLFEFLVLIFSSADLEEARRIGDPKYFRLPIDVELMNFCSSAPKIGILPMSFWEEMNSFIRSNAEGITYRSTIRNSPLRPHLHSNKKRRVIIRVSKKKAKKPTNKKKHPSMLIFTSNWG